MSSNDKTLVSFTYDDGHSSGIDIAAPSLETVGFRGTFFLTPGIYDVQGRAADWRSLADKGHEIGNHTWDHPCDKLNSYSINNFEEQETGRAEQWLNTNIGYDSERTYAYICGLLALGPDPGAVARYRELVQSTFLAARGAGGGPSSAAAVRADRFVIASNAATWGNDSADDAIAYVESAIKIERGWAVLAFHQIIFGPARTEIETSQDVHEKILNYVADHPDRFLVVPFREGYRMMI